MSNHASTPVAAATASSPGGTHHILDSTSSNAQRQFFDDQEAALGQALPQFLSQTSAMIEASVAPAEPVALPTTQRLLNHRHMPEGWVVSMGQSTGGDAEPRSKRRDPSSGSITRRKQIEAELLASFYGHPRTRKFVGMLLWHLQKRKGEGTETSADELLQSMRKDAIDLPIVSLDGPRQLRL